MLVTKTQNGWLRWSGEILGDIRYPSNVELLWSDKDLAAIGLVRVVDGPIPDGKLAAGWTLTDAAGVPTNVPTLADAPTPQQKLDAFILDNPDCAPLVSR